MLDLGIESITSVIVCKRILNESDPAFPSVHITGADPMYLYAIRLLLERVSWYIRDAAGIQNEAIVTFGHLVRFKTEKLHTYRSTLEAGDTRIEWSVFRDHPFRVKGTGDVELLQLADISASALYKAIEPHDLGMTERRYLDELSPIVYRRGSASVLSYGLKVIPARGAHPGASLEFLGNY